MLFCRLLIFFKIDIFEKKYFKNTIRVSNSLDPDQARQNVGPDLGPNCLQILSADDTGRQRVNSDDWIVWQRLVLKTCRGVQLWDTFINNLGKFVFSSLFSHFFIFHVSISFCLYFFYIAIGKIRCVKRCCFLFLAVKKFCESSAFLVC